MRRSVRFHPAALQDADDAAAWYAERSSRAANRFLGELERLIDLIAVSPGRFRVFDGGFHSALFRRFPYYLVFRVDGADIVILAVAHGKRRPRFWRSRI
jgi:plasmid stabilization system protein ParE